MAGMINGTEAATTLRAGERARDVEKVALVGRQTLTIMDLAERLWEEVAER